MLGRVQISFFLSPSGYGSAIHAHVNFREILGPVPAPRKNLQLYTLLSMKNLQTRGRCTAESLAVFSWP